MGGINYYDTVGRALALRVAGLTPLSISLHGDLLCCEHRNWADAAILHSLVVVRLPEGGLQPPSEISGLNERLVDLEKRQREQAYELLVRTNQRRRLWKDRLSRFGMSGLSGKIPILEVDPPSPVEPDLTSSWRWGPASMSVVTAFVRRVENAEDEWQAKCDLRIMLGEPPSSGAGGWGLDEIRTGYASLASALSSIGDREVADFIRTSSHNLALQAVLVSGGFPYDFFNTIQELGSARRDEVWAGWRDVYECLKVEEAQDRKHRQ